jgi:hypothetical protein
MERTHIVAFGTDKFLILDFGTVHHTNLFSAKGTRLFAENVFKEIAESHSFTSFKDSLII